MSSNRGFNLSFPGACVIGERAVIVDICGQSVNHAIGPGGYAPKRAGREKMPQAGNSVSGCGLQGECVLFLLGNWRESNDRG
jgi:hypothetical protein